MTDYIKRDDAINVFDWGIPDADVKCGIAIQNIKDIPTADVRENVRGEWLNMERIEDDKAEYITEWQQAQCSVCHKWHTTPYMYFFTHYDFCPNCGAEMGGDKS